MKHISILFLALFFLASTAAQAQTVIPNGGFENWTNFGNYSDPTGWDTPNQELMMIPFIGITVVSKSTDNYAGTYSAKLETKHYTIPPMEVPGFMTCGQITVDLGAGTFILSGGVPVVDIPTHLKGYYKYFPKGGDSCVIGIGLTKTAGGVQDTIGVGYFSTKDTVSDWTPFSAWIAYENAIQPDSMNIIAMSTAQDVMTVGTTLFVDELYLDYTVGFNRQDPSGGIDIYNDQETRRLMLFFNFPEPRLTTIKLIGMNGQAISSLPAEKLLNDRRTISYADLGTGVYLVQIIHGDKVFTRKFFLNN